MLVIAWGVLKTAWESFFPEDKFTTATEKAVEGLQSILKANEQLRESLENTYDTVKHTELTYTTFAGVLQTVSDMSAGIQKAASDEAVASAAKAKERIAGLKQEIKALETDIAGRLAGPKQERDKMHWLEELGKWIPNLKQANTLLDTRTASLEKEELALKKVLDGERNINEENEKADVTRFLDRSMLMLESSTALEGRQESMIETLKSLKIRVLEGTVTWDEYDNIVATLGKNQSAYVEGLLNAEQATALLAKETIKLSQIVTTPYDKSIDALDSLLTSFEHIPTYRMF